jgi:hypothetical protein
MLLTIGTFTEVASPVQFLDLISRVMLVYPAPEEPVAEKELLAGELNDLEKTIWTARSLTRDEFNRLAEIANNGGKKDGLFYQRLSLLKSWHEVMDQLFWTTIRTRFGAQLADPKYENIGIRTGHQVVLVERVPFDAMQFFSDTLTTVLTAQSGHNCASCAEYDQCDLPIKKPLGENSNEKPDRSKMN